MNRGISIIICCYNSGWIIRRTLEALKAQRFGNSIPYEILLVDNKCTDNTVVVAEDTMRGSKIEFRVIKELSPGLANARRRGIKEAKYEYVLYCDDDNLLCPSYVETMVEILDDHPNVGAVGGKGVAEFQIEPPDIIKRNLIYYAIGSQMDHRDWLFGAGLTLRTSLVRDVYDNQRCYLMGRKGKELLSGDDSELTLSIVLRGYQIFPTDDVFYTHILKKERLVRAYYDNMVKGLLLPRPLFDIMRAAIYERPFLSFIKKYIACCKNIMKYSIIRWKPWSESLRFESWEYIRSTHYWGIFTLHRVYNEWLVIKLQRNCKIGK